MRIRAQLVVVVLAAVAPIATLAAWTTGWLWDQQREAYQQRFLERVTALRLALDTEIVAVLRTLRSLADSWDGQPSSFERMRGSMGRILVQNPGWAAMGIVQADGRPVLRIEGWDGAQDVRLDDGTLARVVASRGAVVSNLHVVVPGRLLLTFVAVPVLRNGDVEAVVYAGIEHGRWLDLLRSHAIAPDATLTLNDGESVIIARTLNDEAWAGKTSSPGYWQRTIGHDEGMFENVGLEGQRFYTAFSRLRNAPWVLGTGVPTTHVESALRRSTATLIVGTLAAAAVATLFAFLIGRRIAGGVAGLERAAEKLVEEGTPPSGPPLSIVEVESVRQALIAAGTRLREREVALREVAAREAALRADAQHENEAKDQFLAMLGHELRNPIAAISAATQVLALRPGEAHEREARLVLERQVRQLAEIVDDLLDVARLAGDKVELKRRPVDLAELVRRRLATIHQTGRSAHLHVQADLAPAQVVGDETRLEQIAGNLIENACKYTPAGGHVAVRVGAAGESVELEVRDDGLGIAPDLLPRVFDLFTQGERTRDRSQGGLGLGLAVVKRLVELHGGTVTAASDGPGRGARFVVRLPAAQFVASHPPPLTGGELAPCRIVVVEDNADIANGVASLLRMKGHDVTIAASGPEGLQAIVERSPDVALVDLGLPGFDGLELARRVRAAPGFPGVRLIALTGYGAQVDRDAALAAGFDAFLVKPFDFDNFVAACQPQREPMAPLA